MEHIYDDGTKTRNPVRRSNSSPEMSNSKNPFLHSKHDEDKSLEEDGGKKGKMYSKDMRVSCEAIPEEMAGKSRLIHLAHNLSIGDLRRVGI